MLSQQIEGAEYCSVGKGVEFGRNARVVGKRVTIGSDTVIGDGVQIRADVVQIGRRCKIEENVASSWHGGNSKLFMLGDCCFIGWDSRILVKEFCAGDYVVLHNHLLVNGDAKCTVGNNAWMGQNGILNANSPLKIGNNVGIGAYSAVWTHGKFGALIDGCLMHKEAPVVIEDDVCMWRTVVSPGVRVGRRTVLLPGSVITKDAPPNSCFGGVPATDLSDRIMTYRSVSMEEKFRMMEEFVEEFVNKGYPGRFVRRAEGDYVVSDGDGEAFRVLLKPEVKDADIQAGDPALVVTLKESTTRGVPNVSVFDLSSMTYTKWLSDPEVKFMWFLLDSRARFNPVEPK